MNPSPIFIVGCPRSGTTLLRDLLRSHPNLTFPFESHFIPAFYRGCGHPRDEREAVKLARRILDLEWIRGWKLSLKPEEFAADRSFQDVLDRLYGAWARRESKPRWGDKTPHYVMEIPVLRELFPAGKVIHIIRDGRDVAVSWLRAGMEPRNVFEAARRWKKYVMAGRASGDACWEVRYESLLARPEETMRTVCAFIGEPFSEAVLERNPLPRTIRQPIFGSRRVLRPAPAKIDGANVAKWKTAMSGDERALFESVAGDLLATLGYETEGTGRPIGRWEQRFWRIHHQVRWTATRLNMRGNWRWLQTEREIRRARRLCR